MDFRGWVSSGACGLRRHLAGEPILARRVGAAERAWTWCRRNKGLAALGALLIASLIAGTGFSLPFAVRANNAAGLANQKANRANVQAEEAGRQHRLDPPRIWLSQSC
jgi:eukaryotic-like serine/threonine-protein kinase